MVDRQSITTANPWVTHLARIQGIDQELPNVATYDLVLEDPAAAGAFEFQPGQFNMLYLPGFGEAAISISSDPGKLTSLQHTVRVAGNVTTALSRLHVGDQLGVRGPFGSAWPLEACRGKDVVIACGGIGLPPLRPLIYYLIQHRETFGRVHLLYGARTPGELLFTNEFQQWRAAGIEMAVTVDLGSDDWTGDIGVVPLLFHRLHLDSNQTIVMTCGPEVMMRFVIFEALARGIDPESIYLSMERNMQCAVGLCGACQLGPKFVCKDGPVFTYEQMEPYLMVGDL